MRERQRSVQSRGTHTNLHVGLVAKRRVNNFPCSRNCVGLSFACTVSQANSFCSNRPVEKFSWLLLFLFSFHFDWQLDGIFARIVFVHKIHLVLLLLTFYFNLHQTHALQSTSAESERNYFQPPEWIYSFSVSIVGALCSSSLSLFVSFKFSGTNERHNCELLYDRNSAFMSPQKFILMVSLHFLVTVCHD